MMNRTPPPLLLFFSFISGFPFSFCHLFWRLKIPFKVGCAVTFSFALWMKFY
jgi:hypothetical protein